MRKSTFDDSLIKQMREMLNKSREEASEKEKYYIAYEHEPNDSCPKKFYVVDRKPEAVSLDPMYDIDTRTFTSFSRISRQSFGRHRLFDIDRYLMEAFFDAKDFFETYGQLSVNKNLFILNADCNGKFHIVRPVFNNQELKAILDNSPSSTDLAADMFAQRFLSLLQSDPEFYDFLVSKRGKSQTPEIKYFNEKVDVFRRYCIGDSTIEDDMIRRVIPSFYTEDKLRDSITDELNHNYPILRKQLLDTHFYQNNR